MSPNELLRSWLAARERILERHRKLSHRQKRKASGVRTTKTRVDYQRFAVEGRISATELRPRSEWAKGELSKLLNSGHIGMKLNGEIWVSLNIASVELGKLYAGKIKPADVKWELFKA